MTSGSAQVIRPRPTGYDPDSQTVWLVFPDPPVRVLPVTWPGPKIRGKTVCHYTSRAKSREIIKPGTLWATEYRSLEDDPEEFYYGFGMLQAAIDRLPTAGLGPAHRRWLADVRASIPDRQERNYYVMCGSLRGDVEHLWDNYATGDGRAIEMYIDFEDMLVVLNESPYKVPEDTFNYLPWRTVVYEPAEQVQLADQIAAVMCDSYPDWNNATVSMMLFVAFVKTPAYAPEQELRRIVMTSRFEPRRASSHSQIPELARCVGTSS